MLQYGRADFGLAISTRSPQVHSKGPGACSEAARGVVVKQMYVSRARSRWRTSLARCDAVTIDETPARPDGQRPKQAYAPICAIGAFSAVHTGCGD